MQSELTYAVERRFISEALIVTSNQNVAQWNRRMDNVFVLPVNLYLVAKIKSISSQTLASVKVLLFLILLRMAMF